MSSPAFPYNRSLLCDHVYMIGGVTLLGGLPSLLGRVTLSAGVAFCHVNVSRSRSPPSRGLVHVTFASVSNSKQNFSTFYLDC